MDNGKIQSAYPSGATSLNDSASGSRSAAGAGPGDELSSFTGSLTSGFVMLLSPPPVLLFSLLPLLYGFLFAASPSPSVLLPTAGNAAAPACHCILKKSEKKTLVF